MIRNKMAETVREYVKTAKREMQSSLDGAKRMGLVLLLSNASSFATVAMEKGISGYSREQAAFINSLHAVPFLYDIGFNLGHLVFYGDDNFLKTKEDFTGYKNLLPRPWLGSPQSS